jgi:aspartyl-tRNA synthetase
MSGSANWQRTHHCGELSAEHVGQTVTLNGWIHARRDHASVYFIDLRDRFGRTQLVVPKGDGETKFAPEEVLSVRGEVVARDASNVRADNPTGHVELHVTAVEVLATSKVPPFEIQDGIETAIETRLRYRYLDIRRPEMQQKLLHRSKFIGAMRNAFLARDFVEVETPILTKATPEGARDYLVPSRVHAGEFYALPQSPQIFKQILMVAGMDRYFQVARCFRDEDLRADRQPEFTQLDMEMSFVEEEDVFACWEGVLGETFKNGMGVDLPATFPRMTWRDAMERYGSDKPDTRYGMELVDLAEWVPTCDFQVFQGTLDRGGRVMGLCVKGGRTAISRGNVKNLEKLAKEFGAKGLAWWKPGEEGGGAGPLAKFCAGAAGAGLLAKMGADENDLLLFCADVQAITWRVLGELRSHLAKTLELIPDGLWNFLWVTSFPMFERTEDGTYTSSHHPFTAPADWELSGDPAEMESRAYDLVLNGWELGSGSVRIHRSDVQQKVFELLGISPEERDLKFGFLLEALSYGAPPHAGFAIGLDRLVALTLRLDSIRDVVAFPKTTSAQDLMCQAPSTVTAEQLGEVHIETRLPVGSSEA